MITNELDEKTGEQKKIEVILKTAQLDKNQNFGRYLMEEQRIIKRLEQVEGIVHSLGEFDVINPFNNNKLERHVALEYMQYGSLHALSIYTKAYEEPTAFVVIR